MFVLNYLFRQTKYPHSVSTTGRLLWESPDLVLILYSRGNEACLLEAFRVVTDNIVDMGINQLSCQNIAAGI